MQRYQNARTAIEQIRSGEWRPDYNPYSMEHLTAERMGLELWIGNGAWFCEIGGGTNRYFGLFWRHLVWWGAARRMKRSADKAMRESAPVPVLK